MKALILNVRGVKYRPGVQIPLPPFYFYLPISMKCELVAKKDKGRKTGKKTGWTCHAGSLDELARALYIHLSLRDQSLSRYRRDGIRQNEPEKVIREDGKIFRVRSLIEYHEHGYSHPPGMLVEVPPKGAHPSVKW